MKRIFYVCSYGGSGSKMLCSYLNNFGITYHIHSNSPPNKLTHVGGKNTYHEWVNNKEIPTQKLKLYNVIYIYRNPADAILSRFWTPSHLKHIQADENITIKNVTDSKNDLYKIEEFYNNYTTPNNRNYKIYCVKYESFFDNIEEFNNVLNLSNDKKHLPTKKESPYFWGTTKKKDTNTREKLSSIYNLLIDKMNKSPFIKIV